MTTRTTSEKAPARYSKSQLLTRTIAIIFSLLASLILAGGAWGRRADLGVVKAGGTKTWNERAPVPPERRSDSPGRAFAQTETRTATPLGRSKTVANIASTSQPIIRNFDDLATGIFVTGYYPDIKFSSTSGKTPITRATYSIGPSLPNVLCRWSPSIGLDTYADLYVDFPQAVNNLSFRMVGVHDVYPVANIDYYVNGTLQTTVDVTGCGYYCDLIFAPSFNNITRVVIRNIRDSQGIDFDDFSFTIPATPTPTPTPTPSPSPTPFPPTNLGGEGHIEEITLVWDLQANTTSYNVKRRVSFDPSWTVIATGVQPTTLTSFGNTTLIGRYRDYDAIPDVNYSYAVTAVNAYGASVNSNVFSAMLEPSCGAFQAEQGPVQQYYPDRGNGWRLTANVNGPDGLVLTDVSLKSRYMAKMMSVPYFFVKTNKMSIRQRGELTQNSDASTMRARLLRYSTPYSVQYPDGHVVETHFVAEYAVDRLTSTSKSCLLITQDYSFREKRAGDQCEPSATVPCARFYPRVSYKFRGRAGETLESINVAQRLHYRVDGKAENTLGLFRDCNSVPCLGPNLSFVTTSNPAPVEKTYNVIKNGRDAASWDNIHQTQFERVDEPPSDPLHGVFGGCPDCVHTHWRWGEHFRNPPFNYTLAGFELVGKNPSFFYSTDQDVEIGIVRYKPGEEHPTGDFKALVDTNESLRNLLSRVTGSRPPFLKTIQVIRPADVLYWYSGTSYEPDSDLFFKHGSWFNPDFSQQVMAANATGSAANSPEAVQDGVRSITYGHVYKDGATTFGNVDPSTLAALPTGYVALDNRAYQIATDAIVSGPHVVSFDVPSINDQITFNDLAIFHLEQDPFDPDNMVWVDDTILSPGSPASDFANRIVNARVNDIGYFAIGKLVQAQPDPGSSDLAVSVVHSSSSVVVENNLSYTLHIMNNGPQVSTRVGVIDVLPQETTFVSASPTQGTYKFKEGSVYCKLGALASGGSADITIVVKTFEDKTGIPSQGRSIVNTVVVAGDNDDPNLDNNSATDNASLLSNPNSRPAVSITSPTPGATFNNAATVNITASATDGDGSVSRVEFYDGSALIGTITGSSGNQYQFLWTAVPGSHSIVAVATDNGGRTNTSDPVTIFVNGNASTAITSPSPNAVFDPSSSLTITANATGSISKVEFFANSISLGQGSGANPYSVTWSNLAVGNYAITAVVTDGSGAITTSAPVTVSVTSKPTVTIVSPTDGTSYPLPSKVVIMATAQDSDGFVNKVDFYASGSLVGTGLFIGQDRFTIDWISVPPGFYSLTAIATDNLGASTTSGPITIGVNTSNPNAGEFIWFDDSLPAGATPFADGEDWYWVDANPGALSGTKAHQSKNFAQLDLPSTSFHQHFFDGATAMLPVNVGEKLFTYVFLDINNMPREIMLQWNDGNGWQHRAYWGQNRIGLGTDGTNSRRCMGPLPRAGQWVRLEVPASVVGLENTTVSGMAFTLDAGRATWDFAGKTTANAPPPTSGDFVWVEDAVPTGSILETVDDQWQWLPPHFSGTQGHRSYLTVSGATNARKFRSHSFRGAQDPMNIQPGDVLFTYVFLDGNNMPDELVLQWHDGSGWEHRAYWGQNLYDAGRTGTESRRFMGGIPPGDRWVRLEVPASYVGLENKVVSGMAYGFVSKDDHAGINWDYSGKSSQATLTPLPLSATTAVYQIANGDKGVSYSTNANEPGSQSLKFYAHPNQAAATVPFYRFKREGDNPEKFYSQCLPCYDGHGWVNDGIWAYVYAPNPPVPAAPSSLAFSDLNLSWQDNSANETGFRIEFFDGGTGLWTQLKTVDANVTLSKVGSLPRRYRVQAFNSVGNSGYSNEVCSYCNWIVYNTPPQVYMTTPADGDVVDKDLTIDANVFDEDGAGTIARVEFFADGNKLGESIEAPYSFVWSNAATGSHVLTAKATDTAGATTTSNAVSITVDNPLVGRTNVALAANGGEASASSSYPSSQTEDDSPGTAINGNRTGKVGSLISTWNDATPANSFPDWLEVAFNGSKSIDEIDVFTVQNNYSSPSEPTETMTFSLYGLTGFDVQYWNGSAWATVTGGSVTGNNKVWKKLSFSPITTTKIRVLTNASGDGYSRITELEAWGTPAVARANVALAANGGVASASSSYPSSQTEDDSPGTAINGNRTGKVGSLISTWNDATPANSFPDWLEVAFNGSKSIDEIDVFTVQNNYSSPSEPTETMTFSLYGLTGFNVQYWNGSAWATVTGGSVTGNNKVWKKITFSPIITTKIRVLTNASPDGYSRITELEAWGTPGG